MECPECGKFVRCVDSRKKLSYMPTYKSPSDIANPPVRERKYICGNCQLVVTTREKIFDRRTCENIKDKRIKVRKTRKKKK